MQLWQHTLAGHQSVIAVIADDLTGASDAGVQFARRGLTTRVLLNVRGPALAAEVEVVVVDTDSRALPADVAYTRVREVAERLRTLAPERVYKKVDSTLRGNLGAEIDAVMDALDFRLAIVAPAFPGLGRTTRHGRHHLHGRPVHDTEIGRDPKTPVRESLIGSLLRQQSRRTPAVVSVDTVESGPRAIRDQVEAHAARGASLMVCDAESDAALRAIVTSCADRRDVLWVGSAGLADHLADTLRSEARPPCSAATSAAGGPLVVVAGSASEITRRQVQVVCACRGVALVELDPVALAEGDAELERCRHELATALAGGQDCALVVASQPLRLTLAPRIVDVLGRLAADCARSHALRGLVLTGGDTARAVCRHLGVAGIQLIAEVEPGVPLGRLVGTNDTTLLAVTKAGAFGSERTLVHALEQLKGDG